MLVHETKRTLKKQFIANESIKILCQKIILGSPKKMHRPNFLFFFKKWRPKKIKWL